MLKRGFDSSLPLPRAHPLQVASENNTKNSLIFRLTCRESIKRGMIRYLYLAIDLSKTMSEGDMRPSRLAVTLRIVQDFVTNYFDQNPLSQLGILVTRSVRPLFLF